MKINRREKSSRHCKHMTNGALTFTAHVLRSEVYRESGELKRDIWAEEARLGVTDSFGLNQTAVLTGLFLRGQARISCYLCRNGPPSSLTFAEWEEMLTHTASGSGLDEPAVLQKSILRQQQKNNIQRPLSWQLKRQFIKKKNQCHSKP